MFAWAGNQKAWKGAIGMWAAALVTQLIAGQGLDLSKETSAVADLATQAGLNLVPAVVGYATVWFTANVNRFGEMMRFGK